jgi:hypothetical protein
LHFKESFRTIAKVHLINPPLVFLCLDAEHEVWDDESSLADVRPGFFQLQSELLYLLLDYARFSTVILF